MKAMLLTGAIVAGALALVAIGVEAGVSVTRAHTMGPRAKASVVATRHNAAPASQTPPYSAIYIANDAGTPAIRFANATSSPVTLSESSIVTDAFAATMGNQDVGEPGNFPVLVEPSQAVNIPIISGVVQPGDGIYINAPGGHTLYLKVPQDAVSCDTDPLPCVFQSY